MDEDYPKLDTVPRDGEPLAYAASDEPRKGYYDTTDGNMEENVNAGETIGISEKGHMDVALKDEEKEEDTEKPLLQDDSIRIDIKAGNEGQDTPTLPLPEKKKKKAPVAHTEVEDERVKTKLPVYLFPITRMKNAWNSSSNIVDFLGRAFCIIFSTIGWFTCAGGIPFVSLVMLIIGCIYVNDCRKEPKIPVYLIVTGVLGTLQHIIAIWTKYVPRESQGRLKVYRSYCRVIDSFMTLFLIIWFILGCIWVYGIYDDVDLRHPEHEEYCNMTVYYFSFWLFNLTFILLSVVIVLSLCFIVCIIATPREEEKGVVEGA